VPCIRGQVGKKGVGGPSCVLNRPEKQCPHDHTTCLGKHLEQFALHATLLMPLSGPLATVSIFHGFAGLAKSHLKK